MEADADTARFEVWIGYKCHRVADANFAIGDLNFIG
jgi:hypothetical protein